MKHKWVLDNNLSGSVSGNLKEVGVGEFMIHSGEKLVDENERKTGLSYSVAAFFLVAQMAGAGFLALPRGIADAGWTGIFMVILFCVSVGFSATRLGKCWVILEERWEEYKQPARQPYMEIAYRALGVHGRRFALAAVLITQTGSTIVYIILISEMMKTLVPSLSQCEWCLIVAAVVLPAVWLGSPKDFWQASVLAVLATLIAIIVIVAKMLVDREKFLEQGPTYPNPSISSFSLGFGTILFSFGGASVFPTIQNDMRNRSEFWKSTVVSFAAILMMYLPVGIIGYFLIGNAVKSNILLSVGPGTVVTIAIAMQIINLFGTYIISISPVVQSIEDILGIPSKFGWKRVSLRSLLVAFEVVIAFSVPDFGLIMNLIGGSTMSCMSFILPPLMYMKLVDDKSNNDWPERKISILQRIYLCFIIALGVIGGISATTSSSIALLQPSSFRKSCFVNFYGVDS